MKLVAGLTKNKRPVVVDLKKTPHVGVSGPTGTGKSTLATGLAVQVLHRGGQVLILDQKLISYPWALDLPNVRYCGDIPAIHDGLMWLGQEIMFRKQDALTQLRDGVPAKKVFVGEPVLVLADEMNTSGARLKKHWRDLGNKGDSDAASFLEECMFAGRACDVHAVVLAQQLTARAAAAGNSMNGGASRENMEALFLLRCTENTQHMLVPEHFPLPPIPEIAGRAHYCVGNKVTEVQLTNWSDEDAREYALSGKVTAVAA